MANVRLIRRNAIVGVVALAVGIVAAVSNSLAGAAEDADVSRATASPNGSGKASPPPVDCPGCWHPPVRVSWNWVIKKVPTAPYRDVQMYDIDGFNASAADVAALHGAGKKVVCYVSAGSYEDWRPDASRFPAAIIGSELDGWPGEKWLDVRDVTRSDSALAAIMNSRFDMCKDKGFDAVEFDNIDGYSNKSGFPLNADDQLYYNVFVANAARSRGLSTMMKNDGSQISALLPYFDMALNEQCNEFRECGVYNEFVRAGKPVFNAEYASSRNFCEDDNNADINGVNFSRSLDDTTFEPCR
jgi:hypothetical protein